MAFLFAPMHELSHGTAFRSRWLNEAVFRLVSFFYISPPVFFRYFHAAHHTYTQIRGKDPDIVLPGPASWGDYLYYVSSIPLWRRNAGWFFNHSRAASARAIAGTFLATSRACLPRGAGAPLPLRIVAVASVALSTWAALIYWVIPRLMGEPAMRWMRVTEHVGCEYTPDLRRNTRTTQAAPRCARSSGTCPTTPSTISARRFLSMRCRNCTALPETSSMRSAPAT
jgi:fatty acid desaturase